MILDDGLMDDFCVRQKCAKNRRDLGFKMNFDPTQLISNLVFEKQTRKSSRLTSVSCR
jgi:hypothetical protein